MKVIKHGNRYGYGPTICPECGCTFIFNIKDINTEKKWDPILNYLLIEKRIYCPECNKKLHYNDAITKYKKETNE